MKNLLPIIIVFLSFKCVAQVTSVTGTTSQINASASTGAVTLSLPQSIATTGSPQFGKLAIGIANSAIVNLYNAAPITGGTLAYSNLTNAVVQPDVIGTSYAYRTFLSTAAASFILDNLIHYGASRNIIGAGSTVTTQIGFRADATMIGAVNNLGFVGQIPIGTGRWNLYMSGTASNYLAGNLGIGTTNPTEKLSVNGNIRAKEVKVESVNWPDYVFHETYSLQPLSEVEKFVQTNQHLPGIPSALEVEKEGLNLGEMNAKLLKKIEELTLYMIEQQKQTEQIKQEQGIRIAALEKALLTIREKIN